MSAQEIISQEVMTFLSALHVRPSNGAKLKVSAVIISAPPATGRPSVAVRQAAQRRAARLGTRTGITLWIVDCRPPNVCGLAVWLRPHCSYSLLCATFIAAAAPLPTAFSCFVAWLHVGRPHVALCVPWPHHPPALRPLPPFALWCVET